MINKIFKSELGKGAIILLITMNIFNLLNFAFNILMGRFLSIAEYGILMTLMSFTYLYGIPSEAIQGLVSKYTSKFNVKNRKGETKHLLKSFLKKGTIFALGIFIILFIITPFLSDRLRINFWLMAFFHILIFSGFYGPVTRGILQGKKRFKEYGFSLLTEGVLKILLAICFVVMGFGVFGAINAVVISIFLGVLISLYFCKDILKEKEGEAKFEEIKATPYFITMIAIMFFLSMDIIIAKWFFSAEIVGQYAVLSVLVKILFLGTNGIGKAMFPISSERKEREKESKGIFIKSFFVTGALCLIGILFYYFIPDFIINLLYGSKYSGIGKYLVYTGISFSFLALTNLILLYGLSIEKIRRTYLLFIFIILEVVLFSFMHNSLFDFIQALLISNIVIFIGSYFLVKKS